jgi:hypothetical protein
MMDTKNQKTMLSIGQKTIRMHERFRNLFDICLRIGKHDSGQTVVEMIIATVLILVIVAFGARTWSFFIHSRNGQKYLIAQQLAQQEMEIVLATRDVQSSRRCIELDGRLWVVERTVDIKINLAAINVSVISEKDRKWMFTLYTEQMITRPVLPWSK